MRRLLRYRNIVLLTRDPWKFHHAVMIVVIGWIVSAVVNLPVFASQVLSRLEDSKTEPPICGHFCMPQNWVSRSPTHSAHSHNHTSGLGTFQVEVTVKLGSMEVVLSVKQVYGSGMLFLQFVVPLFFLVFCYFKILLKVRRDMVVSGLAGSSHPIPSLARPPHSRTPMDAPLEARISKPWPPSASPAS